MNPPSRRQPPPHRRCSDGTHTSQMMMVGDLKCRSRPNYFRRCKKERPTSIESLPDELLFLILVGLPADYLHDRARLVCRRWYHIIHSRNFINAHLQHSTYGLLFSFNRKSDTHPILMTATATQGGGGLIQTTNEFSDKCRSMFLGSCNGLIMEVSSRNDKPSCVHIINPVTKQAFVLPSLSPCVALFHMRHIYFGIAYAAASMEYKVAVSYHSYDTSLASPLSGSIVILSVGVDNSWRQVRVDHLFEHDMKLVCTEPLITEGFMHWVQQAYGKTVVTLDVETEILTVSEVPFQNYGIEKPKYYLSTGRSLSLLIRHGYGKLMYSWELWEMNPKTKEWMKLRDDIKLGAQKQRLQQFACCHDLLKPVGWVKYPEVVAMCCCGHAGGRSCRTCIFYNLDTHEINSTELPELFTFYPTAMYKNSLIWLTKD